MKGRLRVTALGVAMLSVVAICAGGGRIETTEAAWTGAQYGSAGSVSGATLIAPSAATCVPASVVIIGLQSVKLTWSSPQSGNQRVEITKNGVTGSDSQNIVQTGQTAGLYQYTATYTTAKLLNLVNLGDLLGGTYQIRIYSGYPGSVWWSTPASFNLNVILLGLGSSCPAA